MKRTIGALSPFVQPFRSSRGLDLGCGYSHSLPTMVRDLNDIRDRILQAQLPAVAFDGWTWQGTGEAACMAGYDRSMASAVFAGGLSDVLDHLSDWADRRMLDSLKKTDPDSLRVRDRVRLAAHERLSVLTPWKEAVRLAGRYWAVPYRAGRAGRLIWRTADRIWLWAGDTATDYNRLTKRTLLTGVLSATTLVWLADPDPGLEKTDAFLGRRIENVMRMGRFIGKIKPSGFDHHQSGHRQRYF